ncbi:MAG: hypothetical protein ACK4ZM_00140, partial [bacterium]
MSALALGAVFLIGGVIAVTASMIATAAGAALVLAQQSKLQGSISPSVPQSVYDIEEQQKELKSNLQNLSTIVNQSINHIEIQEEKEKLIISISNLQNLMDQQNYYTVQSETDKLVKKFNEILVNNQLFSLQKNEILEKLENLKSKVNNHEDLQKIQIFQSNPNEYTLNEMEKFLFYLEDKYYALDIQVTDPRKKVKNKIQSILEKIKNIDEEYWKEIQQKYSDLDNLEQSYLNLLLDQIKLDISKIKTKQIRKQIYYSQLNHYFQTLKSYRESLENDQEFKISIYYPS